MFIYSIPKRRLFQCSPVTQILRMASSGVIDLSETHRFIVDCMRAVGTPLSHAEQLAEVLVAADYRGHYSHGLNRLEMYVNDVSSKMCDGRAEPRILKQTSGTAWVDGNNGLGPVVGKFCMDLAIRKAKDAGIGWVVAKGSNHYGIAGWYSLRAVEHNMIGMSFTNTSPLLSPTRSKEAALGTNPISVAAPSRDDEDSFVLDMATTSVALGKIEIQRRKNEPIPEGWAQDAQGRITTDAEVGFAANCLMPLGGSELTSGYKGYGLSMMVEVFCGLLAGSAYGPKVRKWLTTEREADLGQCFVAIDPECFAPGFGDRMSDLSEHLRAMTPADPNKPVLIPGDPERIHMEQVKKQGGVLYQGNQMTSSLALAEKLDVQPMRSTS